MAHKPLGWNWAEFWGLTHFGSGIYSPHKWRRGISSGLLQDGILYRGDREGLSSKQDGPWKLKKRKIVLLRTVNVNKTKEDTE